MAQARKVQFLLQNIWPQLYESPSRAPGQKRLRRGHWAKMATLDAQVAACVRDTCYDVCEACSCCFRALTASSAIPYESSPHFATKLTFYLFTVGSCSLLPPRAIWPRFRLRRHILRPLIQAKSLAGMARDRVWCRKSVGRSRRYARDNTILLLQLMKAASKFQARR